MKPRSLELVNDEKKIIIGFRRYETAAGMRKAISRRYPETKSGIHCIHGLCTTARCGDYFLVSVYTYGNHDRVVYHECVHVPDELLKHWRNHLRNLDTGEFRAYTAAGLIAIYLDWKKHGFDVTRVRPSRTQGYCDYMSFGYEPAAVTSLKANKKLICLSARPFLDRPTL